MENLHTDATVNHIHVDDTAKSHMLETARWGKFLAIVCLVLFGLVIVFFSLFGSVLMAARSNFSESPMANRMGGPAMGIMMTFYILFVLAIYFYPIYAQLKFSALIKAALATNDQQMFNKAFSYLKGMYKYIGILMIVLLCIYGIIIFFAIAATAVFTS